MPFRSEKQRRWMHANDPEMAREWEEKTGDKDLPEEVGKMQMVGKFEAQAYPDDVRRLIAQLPLEDQAYETPVDHRPTPSQAAYTETPYYPGRCASCDHAEMVNMGLRCNALRSGPFVHPGHRCILWSGQHEPQIVPVHRLVVPVETAMRKADSPPKGWKPAGKKGGYRSPNKVGGRYQYWYPGQPHPKSAKEDVGPSEFAAIAKDVFKDDDAVSVYGQESTQETKHGPKLTVTLQAGAAKKTTAAANKLQRKLRSLGYAGTSSSRFRKVTEGSFVSGTSIDVHLFPKATEDDVRSSRAAAKERTAKADAQVQAKAKELKAHARKRVDAAKKGDNPLLTSAAYEAVRKYERSLNFADDQSAVSKKLRREIHDTAMKMRSELSLKKATGSNGAAPLFETPEMPDYQAIYNMPEDDPRLEDEHAAAATRRRSSAKRFHGLAGIHGEPPEPKMSAADYAATDHVIKQRAPKVVERKRLFAKMHKKKPDDHSHEPEYTALAGSPRYDIDGPDDGWSSRLDHERQDPAEPGMFFLEEDEAKQFLAFHGMETHCSVFYVNQALAEAYGVPLDTWICMDVKTNMMIHPGPRFVFKSEKW